MSLFTLVHNYVHCTYVIVISPLKVLYPDIETQLMRARSAQVGVSVSWILHDTGVL